MKICLANINPKVGNKKKNIRKMEKIIDGEDADLYVFGEMSLTGYICREEVFSLAEEKDGESIKTMQEIAKEKKCNIIFGMPVMERQGIVYNSAVLVQPDGVGIYNKNFLANFGPFEEKFYFAEGKDAEVFKTKHCNIGMCICYDIFFPEIAKSLALNGADLIVCISASPTISKDYFERVLPARAIENTAFVAYCNLVGEEEGLTFWGGSQIYSPKGDLMGKAAYMKEDYIIQEIDFQQLREARIARPTLRDSKPEIFFDLYNAARGKKVFNEYVKAGLKLGEKIREKFVDEIDVYGNEDVAFGLKLAIKCNRVNVIPSNEIKAVIKGEEEKEIRIEP